MTILLLFVQQTWSRHAGLLDDMRYLEDEKTAGSQVTFDAMDALDFMVRKMVRSRKAGTAPGEPQIVNRSPRDLIWRLTGNKSHSSFTFTPCRGL